MGPVSEAGEGVFDGDVFGKTSRHERRASGVIGGDGLQGLAEAAGLEGGERETIGFEDGAGRAHRLGDGFAVGSGAVADSVGAAFRLGSYRVGSCLDDVGDAARAGVGPPG